MTPTIVIIKEYIDETQHSNYHNSGHKSPPLHSDTTPKGLATYIQRLLFDNSTTDSQTNAVPSTNAAADPASPSQLEPVPHTPSFRGFSLPRPQIFSKHKKDSSSIVIYPPVTQLAEKYTAEISVLRREAESLYGSSPLPSRFTDAELMRYAIHYGFLRSESLHAKDHAMHSAARAVIKTAEWLKNLEVASDEQLNRFAHLVWWTIELDKAHGTASTSNSDNKTMSNRTTSVLKNTKSFTNIPHITPTTVSTPIHETIPSSSSPRGQRTLHIAISRAVHECKGPNAVLFANSVITQIEKSVQQTLVDDDIHDRVSVIVYAGGASSLSASRVAWVFRAVISTLSHHYPGRLHELVLLDLPRVLTWLMAAGQKLVRPETANKVRSMTTAQYEEMKKKEGMWKNG